MMKTKLRSILLLCFCWHLATHTFAQINSFINTPYDKWANVLVNYSLNLQPGETFLVETTDQSRDLTLAVYKEAIKAGAHPYFSIEFSDTKEILYTYASDSQLTFVNPVYKYLYTTFDAMLVIHAPANTKSLININPTRIRMANNAFMEKARKYLYDRVDIKKEMKWCYTSHPTQAMAQEAVMGFEEYKQFVFKSCKLDEPDTKEAWKALALRQKKICDWLNGKNEVIFRGPNIDLKMSIKNRRFINGDGKENFPDGEIYTSPVENSTNGWVRFSYPAIYKDQEVNDIELWIENGKVIREKAANGQAFLTEILDSDAGSRIVGELGIGTNESIKRFSKNMLFDEKMSGTIHIAVGYGFPAAGGKNVSSIHWDMLCDMSEGEIMVDGELFYHNGQFVYLKK